ncbi:acyltransferase family protein [Janibacter cremeus]|uniref:Peptidoglycan/LPS O-acetylase OafA/YrhL n=1 Tax=Janibacter cremeus TaxID=1285192 RepID=A0A852VXV9_9MICO|nr:peptidoglycan/LPS O-acetylase OafA/YrhL [Janibacter cremeus]
MNHVGGLDALRILAALAVFICHLVAYWGLTGLPFKLPELLSSGAHGVDVFIVMSGFVLSLPVFATGRGLDTANFLRRRATRILPPYYVALAFATVIAFSPIATWIVAEQASFEDLAWHMVLLQTWSPQHLATINGSLWSVALEVQLYAVFPVLVLVAKRWGVTPIVAVTALMSVALSAVELPGAIGAALTDEHNLPVRLIQFVTGMACARVVTLGRVPRRRVLWTMVVATAIVAIGANTIGVRVGQVALWALASGFLVLLTVDQLGAVFERTPLERWGLGAYSFYLLHQPITLMLGKVVRPHVSDDRLAFVVGIAICLPVVSLAAWAMYLVVERPVHTFGRARYPVLRNVADPTPAA